MSLQRTIPLEEWPMVAVEGGENYEDKQKQKSNNGGCLNHRNECSGEKERRKSQDSIQETYKERKRRRKRDKRRNIRSTKNGNTTNASRNNKQQYGDENKTWGDELTLDSKWMETNNDNKLRILHMNVNGIVSKNDYIEWEVLLDNMDQVQTDIFCLNETKVDTTQSQVQFDIRDRGKRMDKHMHLNMNSSRQKPISSKSIFKPGGTMIGTRGNWSGRIINIPNDQSKDTIGRWTVTHLKGKNDTILTILSVYQVCQQEGADGENTAYIQQQADLYTTKGKLLNPRKELCKDLKKALQYLNEREHKIIICADINDDVGEDSKNQWYNIMREAGMRHALVTTHDNKKLPRTYDRGIRCLDTIMVNEKIGNDQILRTGILPFYTISASDHRALYMDLDTTQLFQDVTIDTTKHTYRRFTTKNIKKCDIYLRELHNYMSEAKLFQKTKQIKEDINKFLKELEETGGYIGNENSAQRSMKIDLQRRIQSLDTKRSQLMIAAEKKCGKKKSSGMFWYSSKLCIAAQKLSDAKKWLRYLYTQKGCEQDIVEAKQERDKAIANLREEQRNDRQYRDEMMEELAKQRSKPWKMSTESALKVLVEAEKHSNIFKKIRITVKDEDRGGVRNILIPTETNPEQKIDTTTDDRNGKWIEERNIDKIFEIILEQNAKMLTRSNQSITAVGPIQEAIGFQAENEEFLQRLLEGRVDTQWYARKYPQYEEEVNEFLKQMQYSNMSKKMQWQFGSQEYQDLFSKTREETSCGPSGLHMSHWKAALQNEDILEVHATLTWAAFSLGYSYTRWNVSFHSMLMKMKKPYVTKLRIIQIFEGDMNGGLKYLFGRELMKRLVKDGVIDSQAYGSIPGRDPLEAMKVLQYLYENHRLLKKDLVIIFNDAAGCYDRVRANQAELASRRVGCSTDISKTHTAIQTNMTHYVKTSAGISRGVIKWAKIAEDINFLLEHDNKGQSIRKGNIGGIGQGGGASPVEWLTLLMVMLSTFKLFARGASIKNTADGEDINIPVVSFVDDNTIAHSAELEETCEEIMKNASEEMKHWRNILRITGGDLAVQKCTVTLMKWQWGDRTGTPSMMTSAHGALGTVTIPDVVDGNETTVSLRRLEPNVGERQLGIIMPVDGNFQQEMQVRWDMSKELGQRMYRAPLTPYEGIIVYKMYYVPKIAYPISLTKFTQKDCDNIQSQFYRYALPKMGINRHTPKALIFGPKELGGFGFHDLYTDQMIQHITKITQHVRRNDSVGKVFISNLKTMALIVGSSTPFFELHYWNFQYVDGTTTVYHLWRWTIFWKIDLKMSIDYTERSPYEYETEAIMDIAVKDNQVKYKPNHLIAINQCRMYHGVIYASEMLQYDRRTFNRHYLNATFPQRKRSSTVTWPNQPVPKDEQWTIWRQFIRRWYLDDKDRWIARSPRIQDYIRPNSNRITECIKGLYIHAENDYGPDYYIGQMMPILQQYLQVWHGDNTSIQRLTEAMLNNELYVGTDGSYDPKVDNGAGAAVLAVNGDTKHTIVVGAKCNMEHGMSSLTTEQSGIISGLLAIHLLLIRNAITDKTITAHFWIDNEEALRRIRTGMEDDIRLKAFGVSDYGPMTIMRELKECLPMRVNIKFHKVKSHQEGSAEDLPFEAQLNNLADDSANMIRATYYGPVNAYQVYRSEGISIYDDNNIKVNHIKAHVTMQVKGDTLKEYYNKKHGWNQKVIDKVNWKGMDEFLSSLSMLTRNNYLKMIHNWQNVGLQKQRFSQSNEIALPHTMTQSNSLREQYHNILGQCPFQCGQCESHMHFMQCESPKAINARTRLINDLRRSLGRLNVHPTIISIIITGLLWTPTSRIPSVHMVCESTMNKLIIQAIKDQTEIGWDKLKRGFLATQWTQVQRLYDKEQRSQKYTYWNKLLVKYILDTTWNMWEIRNEALHGQDSKQSRLKKLSVTQQQVYNLYDRAEIFDMTKHRDLKKIFKMKRENRAKKGLVSLHTWIKLASAILIKAEHREASAIDKWLYRKDIDNG